MNELSPGLLTALALTTKHIKPLEPIEAKAFLGTETSPIKSVQNARYRNPHSRKTIRARKRNRLAAKSRKRNRK